MCVSSGSARAPVHIYSPTTSFLFTFHKPNRGKQSRNCLYLLLSRSRCDELEKKEREKPVRPQLRFREVRVLTFSRSIYIIVFFFVLLFWQCFLNRRQTSVALCHCVFNSVAIFTLCAA